MSAVFRWVSGVLGTAVVTDYVPTDGWSLTENAEEGSQAESTITLYDDALGTAIQDLTSLHILTVIDDDIPGDDKIVWGGYIGEVEVSRGDTATGRVWQWSLHDSNYSWSRMILTGTAAARPAETDVARMQWMLSTHAADYSFTDTTTYVSTASPVNMDACDYRAQYTSDLADDCAQASGKNWWTSMIGTAHGGPVTVWYGKDTGTAYAGTCVITNDPLLIDGSTYWPPSQDARMVIDPSRIYSGAYIEYDGGATYRYSPAIASAYSKRDTTMTQMNVKSAAKAQARAARYLASWASPHVRVTCTVRVPASAVNQFKTGMRVRALFTHLPGLESLTWYRILRRTVSQRAAGTLYDVELEMTPQGAGSALSCSTAVSSAITASITDQTGASGSYSISLTPTVPSAVVAGFVAGGTGMSTSGTAYTQLYSCADTGHETLANGWATASSTESVTASYTRTGNPQAAVMAAFPTSASAPVQSATAGWASGPVTATLGTAPTPGNLLVAIVTGSANATPMTLAPSSGWGLGDGSGNSLAFIAEGQCNGVHPFGGDAVAVFAACAGVGFGTAWAFGGTGAASNYYSISLTEWQVS